MRNIIYNTKTTILTLHHLNLYLFLTTPLQVYVRGEHGTHSAEPIQELLCAAAEAGPGGGRQGGSHSSGGSHAQEHVHTEGKLSIV